MKSAAYALVMIVAFAVPPIKEEAPVIVVTPVPTSRRGLVTERSAQVPSIHANGGSHAQVPAA